MAPAVVRQQPTSQAALPIDEAAIERGEPPARPQVISSEREQAPRDLVLQVVKDAGGDDQIEVRLFVEPGILDSGLPELTARPVMLPRRFYVISARIDSQIIHRRQRAQQGPRSAPDVKHSIARLRPHIFPNEYPTYALRAYQALEEFVRDGAAQDGAALSHAAALPTRSR